MPSYFILTLLPQLTSFFFFFNDTATTEIYTLSLHDALPIYQIETLGAIYENAELLGKAGVKIAIQTDRKSTRLNSSHGYISYAVFCLKKKKKNRNNIIDIKETHQVIIRAAR